MSRIVRLSQIEIEKKPASRKRGQFLNGLFLLRFAYSTTRSNHSKKGSDTKLASSEAPDKTKQDIYSVETEPTIH